MAAKDGLEVQFKALLTNITFECATSRCDNEKEVEHEILSKQPTHIISFVGRTHGDGCPNIDYLEQPGKHLDNIRDNLYSPIVLAILAKKHKIHLTYLGTGCIFSQNDPFAKQYTEDDIPDFFGSSYSIVKGFTDRLMHMFDVLNIRIRMPITDNMHSRSFITKIVNLHKICSMPNSITVLPDILPIILDMMMKNTTGTFNMVNPGIITHNEILQMYKEVVDPDFSWQNFSIEEQNAILASKRSNNQLDTTKLLTLYPDIPNIHESVRKCLMNITSFCSNNTLSVVKDAGVTFQETPCPMDPLIRTNIEERLILPLNHRKEVD